MKKSIIISLIFASLKFALSACSDPVQNNDNFQGQNWSQIELDKIKNNRFNKIKISEEICAEQDPGNSVKIGSVEKKADNKSLRFAAFGDYGSDNSCVRAVASLVKKFDPDLIITLGDNSYTGGVRPGPIDDNIGQYFSDYIGNYTGKYGPGSPVNRFFPSIGNHDDDNGDISVYIDYFTLPGIGTNTSGNERYYDFVMDPVHFFAVNSTIETEPDGISEMSRQAQWLKKQLAASKAPWKIIYFHHPPYSSSNNGSNATLQWDFEGWGATAVLSGHDHVYERILRNDNNDSAVMPYFVVGTGGHLSLYKFSKTFISGSRVQYNSAHGVLIVDAAATNITFNFHSVENKGVLIDSHRIEKDEHSKDVQKSKIRHNELSRK